MQSTIRALAVAGVMMFATASIASAQGTSPTKPTPGHPPVCAKGVRVYTERSEVPVPFDTLSIPRADAPVRITSPEEAEAAELALRGRAGSVGATGVLVSDEVHDEGGNRRISRSVLGLFVHADSARSQQACK